MSVKIGTRGSPLALAQTKIVQQSLGFNSELIAVITSGDRKQKSGEEVSRDKKDWIFELEQNLLENKIDLAIHSAKDVPIDIASGTKLIPILNRESAEDVLISKRKLEDDFLSKKLKIGTSSLRRVSQLRLLNPNLELGSLRGNINTRIAKIGHDFDGIVLAEAGLKRLGIENIEVIRLDSNNFIPASNQGILVAQIKSDNIELEQKLNLLVNKHTKIAFEVERELVAILGADCHSALGAYCTIAENTVYFNAAVYSTDSAKFINCNISCNIAEYKNIAFEVANKLIAQGAKDYL